VRSTGVPSSCAVGTGDTEAAGVAGASLWAGMGVSPIVEGAASPAAPPATAIGSEGGEEEEAPGPTTGATSLSSPLSLLLSSPLPLLLEKYGAHAAWSMDRAAPGSLCCASSSGS